MFAVALSAKKFLSPLVGIGSASRFSVYFRQGWWACNEVSMILSVLRVMILHTNLYAENTMWKLFNLVSALADHSLPSLPIHS